MKDIAKSRWLALFLAAAAALPASAAPPVFDQLLAKQGGTLVRVPLPGPLASGPAGPALAIEPNIGGLVVLPSGRMLAVTVDASLRSHLNELRPDGSLQPIAPIPAPEFSRSDTALDLALDQKGRLFALVETFFPMSPPRTRLVRLDPVSGAVLGQVESLPPLTAIATAPDGLWASGGESLWKLDPDKGRLTGFKIPLTSRTVIDLESDSAGRVWYSYQVPAFPPIRGLAFIEPWNGGVRGEAAALSALLPEVDDLAIARRCYESANVRCLQNGRFRAEISFEDYQGNSGDAEVARTRSRDTGVFYFFDRANWELMVKVLDGCSLNSHFWVYSSASTDVGYTMTITDTETGAQQVYRNALGTVARTITDNLAFTCSR